MFKSIRYNKSLAYDHNEPHLRVYEYTITDTDFIEVAENPILNAFSGYKRLNLSYCRRVSAIINTYSRRSLNVPLNIVLYMQFTTKMYSSPVYASWCSTQNQIEHYRKYVPNFSQYEKDINKYLLLM